MSKSKSKKKKSNPNIQRGSNKNFKPVKAITPVEVEPENKVEQPEVDDEAKSVEADEVISPVDARGNVVLTANDDDYDYEVEETKEEPKNSKEKSNKEDFKTKNKKPVKEKKKFGRRTKETFSELKKVSWPSFKEVVKKTGVVIAVVLFFTVVLFGVDRLLSWLYGLFTAGL